MRKSTALILLYAKFTLQADIKLVSTKANRSYAEALVEGVSKSVHDVSIKLEHHVSNYFVEIGNIKKELNNKVDRNELDHMQLPVAVPPNDSGELCTVKIERC